MKNEHEVKQPPDHGGPGSQDHHDSGHDGHDHGHGNHFVTVTIDGRHTDIHRGSYIVGDLKRHLGVDPSYELDQVIRGEFRPLGDDARITIKDNELFISHVRTGSSS